MSSLAKWQLASYIEALSQWVRLPLPWTPGRAMQLVFFTFLLPSYQLFTHLTLALDEVLYPDFRQIKVRTPLFLVGNPRSGTTHFHRLMATNTAAFTTFKFWHMFLPAICMRKLVHLASDIDTNVFRSAGQRTMELVQAKLFRSADKVHKLRLTEAEEDEPVLLFVWASAFMRFMMPVPATEPFLYFDNLDATLRKNVMIFYRECIQRHLYCLPDRGASKIFLSKNPSHVTKVASLQLEFPDAKVVYLVRNPLEATASMLSLASKTTKATGHGDLSQMSGRYKIMITFLMRAYGHALKVLDEKYAANNKTIVKYDELVANPYPITAAVYSTLQLPLPAEAEAALRAATARAAQYESSHKYDLGRFGVTPEEIYEQSRAVFERFGFKFVPEGGAAQ